MVDRIIIFKEKHGDSYFDASTDEALARACLAVLRQRNKEGWYYAPTKPEASYSKEEQAILAMTDEQIEAIPEPIKSETATRKAKLVRRLAGAEREYKLDNEWFTLLTELLALPVEEAVTRVRTFRSGRTQPLAYALIEDRNGGEYEGFYIEDLRKA